MPHWQWLESLQHPLTVERGTQLTVAVEECLGVWGQRGVGENGLQILALPHSICHVMT